jgi:hypothetical protein
MTTASRSRRRRSRHHRRAPANAVRARRSLDGRRDRSDRRRPPSRRSKGPHPRGSRSARDRRQLFCRAANLIVADQPAHGRAGSAAGHDAGELSDARRRRMGARHPLREGAVTAAHETGPRGRAPCPVFERRSHVGLLLVAIHCTGPIEGSNRPRFASRAAACACARPFSMPGARDRSVARRLASSARDRRIPAKRR